jgi:3',5'-cyclic AMP phosphodiesterase CpdA
MKIGTDASARRKCTQRHIWEAHGISVVIFVAMLWAQAMPALANPAAEVIYRPTPVPDRVTLTWNADPSVSQAVTWRTDTSVRKGMAQIAVATDGPEFEETAQSIEATTSELKTGLWAAHYHSVSFKSVKPETLYTYRVGDGVNWSEWFHFRTAASEPKPFSFLYFGDVQNSIRRHGSRVIREAFRHAPDARFMIFAGDLAKGGRDDLLWGEFFGTGGWLYAMIPMIPTPGNTEYKDGVLTEHWRAQFTLPLHGLEEIEETSYYIDYQGVRIISLNSMRRLKDQASWLNDVLANNSNRWTILVFHYPLFTLHPDREDNDYLIKHWKKPVLDKHQVDLVFTGHDHAYGRSGLIDGAVYVVSVAGLDLAPVSGGWTARAGEGAQFFQVIRVDAGKLSFEARTATGTLYDAFELHKQPGGTNHLVDLIPKDNSGSHR